MFCFKRKRFVKIVCAQFLITKTMPKREKNIKNFMPSEGGIWKETANDEHLPTFLARYEIEIPSGCKFMRFENELIYCWIRVDILRIQIQIKWSYDADTN